MSFMYMKSVLAQCNGDGKGSVKAEVGSEHCTSDGHITDSEETQEGIQRENQEIKVIVVIFSFYSLLERLKNRRNIPLVHW